MIELQTYRGLVESFGKARVAVVGDIVADMYILGKPNKLSREAPVIVVRYEGEKLVPGSAANTAHNLMTLGATVYPIGVVGNDPPGNAVIEFFGGPLAHTDGIVVDESSHTITKTRIMAGDLHTTKQQVIRIDREPAEPISSDSENRIVERLEAVLPKVDGVIVSDYDYGVVGPRVTELVRQVAGEKIVVVDSHRRINQLKEVTLATPNESEVEAATGIRIESDSDAVAAGQRLLEETGNAALLITRGNLGMMLFERGVPIEKIPVCGGEEIVDVSGAGDTVAAAVTLGLVAGGTFLQAANLANFAAGIVVMKSGTATTTAEEILRLMEQTYEQDRAAV
jgi:rfaE bifunctional protein kinase chain/domain